MEDDEMGLVNSTSYESTWEFLEPSDLIDEAWLYVYSDGEQGVISPPYLTVEDPEIASPSSSVTPRKDWPQNSATPVIICHFHPAAHDLAKLQEVIRDCRSAKQFISRICEWLNLCRRGGRVVNIQKFVHGINQKLLKCGLLQHEQRWAKRIINLLNRPENISRFFDHIQREWPTVLRIFEELAKGELSAEDWHAERCRAVIIM
jgi:hypothetical protein